MIQVKRAILHILDLNSGVPVFSDLDLDRELFEYLQKHYPELLVYPTVHSGMRFMANREVGSGLSIGQKAAYFENNNHFVNVVEGGGMLGYDAVLHTLELMREAYLEEKDMRSLIQIKGMGCGCGGCG